MVQLRLNCHDCGKILGFYNGETFFLKGFIFSSIELQCEECSKKEKI